MTQPSILIIDDGGGNAVPLREALADHYTLSEGSAARAAELAAAEPAPAAVIVSAGADPDHSLSERLAAGGTPVILAAFDADADTEAAAFAAGVAEVLRHPEPQLIRARVRRQLVQGDSLRLARWLGHVAELKEDRSGQHAVRVASYARRLGLEAGMDRATAGLLQTAAPIHDLGKVGIPEAILCKPGRLDEAEWEIMKRHTTIGADIIGPPDTPLAVMARDVVLTHHERWDGAGYPAGLAGEAIPLAGRIMAIVDVFDSLTSSRPYKQPWPLDKAVALIKREAGTQFDPELVRLFGGIMKELLNVRLQFGERPDKGAADGE